MNKKRRDKLSPEAQAVWDRLDENTKKDIQKSNAFKATRNQAIRELVKGRGLRAEIVEELTGLRLSSIYRIINKGDYLPEYAREDVQDLIRSFQAFIKSLTSSLAYPGRSSPLFMIR